MFLLDDVSVCVCVMCTEHKTSWCFDKKNCVWALYVFVYAFGCFVFLADCLRLNEDAVDRARFPARVYGDIDVMCLLFNIPINVVRVFD